jgi:CRP/FNR family transcriptional regulator
VIISNNTVDSLLKTHFFASLDDDSVKKLLACFREQNYSKGDVVLREGEKNQDLFFVIIGIAKSYKVSPDGKEQILSLFRSGDAFNMTMIIDSNPQVYTVEAMSPLTLAYISRSDLYELMNQNGKIYEAILRLFADQIRYLVTLVEDLSFRSVMGRVAKILMMYMSDLYTPHMRITQRDIAAMAGTAREVVSRALRALEDDGYIVIDHSRINITDPEALQELIDYSA